MLGFDPIYMVITGVFSVISLVVSNKLKSKFQFYSNTQLSNRMSGKEIAEKMLKDNGIFDVVVQSVSGHLTDHYNPVNKTVNLSENVYNSTSATSVAVASHEVGHAVQHATGYNWLMMRSKLVPIVNISSKFWIWIVMGGMFLMNANNFGLGQTVVLLGLGLLGIATLFSFITLPVEYDASNRALEWLKTKNMLLPEEYIGAEDSLKWAARTYLVAAIGSLATLVYFAMKFLGNNRKE
ncbi:MAG: zinc metallopeptidase [Solirubrobacteraceae bacterium]